MLWSIRKTIRSCATGLSASRVLAACTELELYGGAQSQPGRRYVAL